MSSSFTVSSIIFRDFENCTRCMSNEAHNGYRVILISKKLRIFKGSNRIIEIRVHRKFLRCAFLLPLLYPKRLDGNWTISIFSTNSSDFFFPHCCKLINNNLSLFSYVVICGHYVNIIISYYYWNNIGESVLEILITEEFSWTRGGGSLNLSNTESEDIFPRSRNRES